MAAELSSESRHYLTAVLNALSEGSDLPTPKITDAAQHTEADRVKEQNRRDVFLRSLHYFHGYYKLGKTCRELGMEEDINRTRVRQLVTRVEDSLIKMADRLIARGRAEVKYFSEGTDGVNYLTPNDINADWTIRVILTKFDREDWRGLFLSAPTKDERGDFCNQLQEKFGHRLVKGEIDLASRLRINYNVQPGQTPAHDIRHIESSRVAFKVKEVFLCKSHNDPDSVSLYGIIEPSGPYGSLIRDAIYSGNPLKFRLRYLIRDAVWEPPHMAVTGVEMITWDLLPW